MEAIFVENRNDFAEWAMQRANAILVAQGSDLATAARNNEEAALEMSSSALGQAIVDALMDAFDGLTGDE